MKISKHERRVLHVLMQGGAVHVERMNSGKMRTFSHIARGDHTLVYGAAKLFCRLKNGRAIETVNGHPLRAIRLGTRSVNSQMAPSKDILKCTLQ